MNTKTFTFAPSVIAAAFLFSVLPVWAADKIARAYDIKNVTEVVATGGISVQLTQGNSENLRVEADPEIMERVSVDLSGKTLTLSVKNTRKGSNFFNWFNNSNDHAAFILQLKSLERLKLTGASRADVGNWTGDSLAVTVNGASKLNFSNLKIADLFVDLSGAGNLKLQELNANKVKFEISGAANADFNAPGQATFLAVEASGASNFRAKSLSVAQAEVGASGASNLDLKVTEYLKANASGASNIRYLGQPKLKSDTSGASHVTSIN